MKLSRLLRCNSIAASLASLRPFTPALTLLALCLLLPLVGCDAYLRPLPPVTSVTLYQPAALLFHFTHANPFHLIANGLAILYFRPRWSTLALAYPAATLAALLYLAITSLAPVAGASASAFLPILPTCGLSAIVCAAFARPYAARAKSPLPFILLQLPFAIIPNFNYILHILSFLIAYSAWRILYLKTGR